MALNDRRGRPAQKRCDNECASPDNCIPDAAAGKGQPEVSSLLQIDQVEILDRHANIL
jgi:hypothetical protein